MLQSPKEHQGKWPIRVCIGKLSLPLMASTYNWLLYHQVGAVRTKKDLNIGWLIIYCAGNDPKHSPYLSTANNAHDRFQSSCTPRIRLYDRIQGTIEYYQPSERGMLFYPGWHYSLPLSERIAMRPCLTLANIGQCLVRYLPLFSCWPL